MPDSLRAGLWDALRMFYFEEVSSSSGYSVTYSNDFRYISDAIWFHYYKDPIDSKPSNPYDARKEIRTRFLSGKFIEVYSFIEFMAELSLNETYERGKKQQKFAVFCNSVLSRERSAFRFSARRLVKISDEQDRKSIEDAVDQDASVSVSEHIKRAASLYSSREMPDYRNSIKESISAVEGAVSYVTNTKSSGISKPLKVIAEKYGIHQALRDGFEKIYAYTSDAEGIRHRMMEKPNVSQDDARFMLVSCSAFANYLLALHARFGAAPPPE